MASHDIQWHAAQLTDLPVKNGFRLRGEQMNRLETFTDASFAFALTMIVISVNDLPGSYAEFQQALKQVPVFVVCFAQLMVFWWGHHVWSRRFGLEDGKSILLSLLLVATVLIYVFPLRFIFTAFFSNATGGWIADSYALDLQEISELFVIFGLGFGGMAGFIAGLNLVALGKRDALLLNALEVYDTRADVLLWSVVAATGFVSVLVAWLLPDNRSPVAGYVYWSLAVTTPLLTLIASKRRPKVV